MAPLPDRRSASIPALWAVQRRYGWCTPEGIRQAAAVMRVTPAYLESVASFYDLLHTEPVGTHQVAVCTNISCWMRGGDELLDAFRAAAEGERTLRHRLRVPGRLRHRPDGLDRRALLRPAGGGRGGDRDRPAAGGRRTCCPRRRWRSGRWRDDAATWERRRADLRDADAAEATPRTRRCARSTATRATAATRPWRRPTASWRPTRCSRSSKTRACAAAAAPASRWGKRPPSCPAATMAQVPLLQRRRVRARRLQGPRADAAQPAPADRGDRDRRARRRRRPRLHLHPRRVRPRRPTSSTPPSPKPTRRATWARTSSAPVATSSWSSTAAPAPTSAARRRRCSTRSRASAATRA